MSTVKNGCPPARNPFALGLKSLLHGLRHMQITRHALPEKGIPHTHGHPFPRPLHFTRGCCKLALKSDSLTSRYPCNSFLYQLFSPFCGKDER